MKRHFGAGLCALVAAALLPLGITAASAQAATSHPEITHIVGSPTAASHFGEFRLAPRTSCPTSAPDFCTFTDVACTANIQHVSTQLHHSAWFRFNPIIGYNPQCVLNPTNSSIWIEDEATEFPQCLPPGHGFSASNEQFGYFYVKYNVGTCGSEPSGE